MNPTQVTISKDLFEVGTIQVFFDGDPIGSYKQLLLGEFYVRPFGKKELNRIITEIEKVIDYLVDHKNTRPPDPDRPPDPQISLF